MGNPFSPNTHFSNKFLTTWLNIALECHCFYIAWGGSHYKIKSQGDESREVPLALQWPTCCYGAVWQAPCVPRVYNHPPPPQPPSLDVPITIPRRDGRGPRQPLPCPFSFVMLWLVDIGRFQKISIPIPRTAFTISEGEGGVHDYGILRAWGVFTIGNPKASGNSTGGISGVESVEWVPWKRYCCGLL